MTPVAPSSDHQPARRSHWPNVVIALIAVFLIGLSFRVGLQAGMATERIEPSWRYRVYAVPIVLSHIFYDHPYDYTAYQKIAGRFVGSTPSMDELIAASRSIDRVDSDGLFFILADDKGIVDFTRLAFRLYGIKLSSLYYMYFTVVLISCLLYVVCYFDDVAKLALLAFLCLAFYT